MSAPKEDSVIRDKASFVYSTGDKYEGNVEIRRKEKTIKINGSGVYTTADGDVYSTEWDNEKPPLDLETTVIYSDGSKFQGYFKDWMYFGKGKYFYPDGSFMKCEFIENCPVHDMTFVDPNGQVWLGRAELGFGWLEPSNHYYDFLNDVKTSTGKIRQTPSKTKHLSSFDVKED